MPCHGGRGVPADLVSRRHTRTCSVRELGEICDLAGAPLHCREPGYCPLLAARAPSVKRRRSTCHETTRLTTTTTTTCLSSYAALSSLPAGSPKRLFACAFPQLSFLCCVFKFWYAMLPACFSYVLVSFRQVISFRVFDPPGGPGGFYELRLYFDRSRVSIRTQNFN